MEKVRLLSNFSTAHGNVHLCWSCIDDFSEADRLELFSRLSPAEQDHVGKARSQAEQQLRLVSRAVLRDELAQRIRVPATKVPLEFTPAGKPYLAGSFGVDLKFNVAHSHNWVVHAFTPGFDIGIDLEFIDPKHVNTDLLRMNSSERSAWEALSREEQVENFFCQWVITEAFLKGIGAGISGLDKWLDESSTAMDLYADSWKVSALPAPDGFVAAIAVPRNWPDVPDQE